MKKSNVTPKATDVHRRPSGTGKPAPAANPLLTWSGAPALHLALIALIGLLAYSNTFHAQFVFDDEGSILENPIIKNLHSFLSGAGYRYNPRRFIGYLTIALNYRLGGLDVTGYHIFNLAVHICNAWLVYALARLTLRTPFFAVSDSRFLVSDSTTGNQKPETRNVMPLLAALLFVAHPLQTQAVTYVVQRFTSLVTMFYLASLICYVRARLNQQQFRVSSFQVHNQNSEISNQKSETSNQKSATFLFFSLSFVSAILAMKTKEIAFTLPIIIAIYEFTFFKATTRKRLLFLLPLALTIVIVPLGLVHTGKPIGEILSDMSNMARETKTISRGDYLLTQFSVIATYLRLLVLPVGQNLDYDYPIYHSLFTPRVFLSLLFLSALLGLAIWLYYRSGKEKQGSGPFTIHHSFRPSWVPFTALQRLIGFGIIWFFVTLSVESSVIPISDVIFEHRLYLPSVGAFCAIAALCAIIARRFSTKTCLVASGSIIMVLAGVTWQRNQVWGSAISILQDSVYKSPEKVRPHNNLANALIAQGRVDEANEQLRIALKLKPDNASALRNLGAAYEIKGLLDEAIEQYRLALNAMPNNMYAHYNLGVALAKKGLTDLAIAQFLIAIQLDPNYADAYNNLGVAYGNKGLIDEAIDQFRHAVRLNPGSADAHNNLGFAYGSKGRMEEAVEEYHAALALQPEYADAYNNLGIVYSKRGAHDQAVELFQKAIALQPNNPKYGNNLANAYRQKLQGN